MLATLRSFALAVPVSLLFSIACWGQTAAFEGNVKGEDGKPAASTKSAPITVHIERTDIKQNYKVNTDKKGHYYYGGLAPGGTFKIWVEVDGKERDSVNGVRSGLGDPKQVDFDLSKSAKENASKQAQMQQQMASGGELTKEQKRDMSPEQQKEYDQKMKAAQATMAKNKALNEAFNAGKTALDAKQFDVAIESFEKAKDMSPDQHVIWGNLADAYAGAAKTKTGADQQAMLDKGIEAYKKAIELKPDDAAYHNNYGLLLAQSKKSDEALAELTKAAELDPPKAGQYYFNGGAVLVNMGQSEAAGAMFKKAIAADPTYAEAHYQYGIYLMGKATTSPDGKITPPDGTKEEFEKYLELKPDGPNAEAAKAMLQSMGATVETDYKKAGAKKTTKKP